ncbi:MAG: hypothetical protein V4621_07265 [Pseudomonadota bacterium]
MSHDPQYPHATQPDSAWHAKAAHLRAAYENALDDDPRTIQGIYGIAAVHGVAITAIRKGMHPHNR